MCIKEMISFILQRLGKKIIFCKKIKEYEKEIWIYGKMNYIWKELYDENENRKKNIEKEWYRKRKLIQKIIKTHIFYTTSTHMGLPPEFKHINEGRKRN